MKLKYLSPVLVVAALCSTAAYAMPITYSIASYDSGSLNGVAFSNSLVTVTYFGDTTYLTQSGSTITENVGVSGVNVVGVGSDLLADSTFFFIDSSKNLAGIYDQTVSGSVDLFNSAFLTYDGASNLGPVVGVYYLPSNSSMKTTKGSLILTGSFTNTGSFQAQIAATPEPSSLLLLGSAVPTVMLILQRKKNLLS